LAYDMLAFRHFKGAQLLQYPLTGRLG
jgi:hypothetical protein